MQADISTLEALLARVEAATGPDRELDADIRDALFHPCERPAWLPFTASLDACRALQEQVLPGWFVTLDFNGRNIGNFARVYNNGLVHEPSFVASSNKPVELVALAALLRALIAQSKEHGHG